MKVKMSENENEVKMKVKMRNSIYKSGIYQNLSRKKKLNIVFTKSQNWIKTVSSWKKLLKALLPGKKRIFYDLKMAIICQNQSTSGPVQACLALRWSIPLPTGMIQSANLFSIELTIDISWDHDNYGDACTNKMPLREIEGEQVLCGIY